MGHRKEGKKMKSRTIGFLGGGEEQVKLANWLAENTPWEVYAMFLESPELSPKVDTAPDFRDVLWLCWTLVLPDPVCREGRTLNAPLWPGRPVDVGQFLGGIGKGVLLLAGETTPEFDRAAAAREVAVTHLPGGVGWEDRRDSLLAVLEQRSARRVQPREVKGLSAATDIPPSGRGSGTAP